MDELLFFKEILLTIVAITTILAATASGLFLLLRTSFKKGKTFQLFETLVHEVTSIKQMIDDKFVDNDLKHKEHQDQLHRQDNRITKLEVIVKDT